MSFINLSTKTRSDHAKVLWKRWTLMLQFFSFSPIQWHFHFKRKEKKERLAYWLIPPPPYCIFYALPTVPSSCRSVIGCLDVILIARICIRLIIERQISIVIHKLQSENVPEDWRVSQRYFPDWEKQKWKRGILENHPRSQGFPEEGTNIWLTCTHASQQGVLLPYSAAFHLHIM